VKERFVTFACALGALTLFMLLFVNPEEGLIRHKDVPRPTTEELRGNGYHAVYAWLQASGIHAVSLRERFNSLVARHDLAPQGNVLIVTLPVSDFIFSREIALLQTWVRAGNTLIVVAALVDVPDWAAVTHGVNIADLKDLSGLDFNLKQQSARDSSVAFRIVPNRAHAYFTGVDQAGVSAAPSQQDWTARVPYEGFMLALAHERESGKTLFWTSLLGDGQIVLIGIGSLFTDRALGFSGNARLFANLIGANLGPRGAVVFDDFHQGLSSAYDPAKFYRDPRLYMTIAVLLALWFTWVLGSTRLRLAPTRIAAPREADLVRTSGGFLARVLGSDVAAQRLFEYFFHRLRLRAAASQSADAWELLDASARVGASELAQLRRWHTQAYQGERVPLVRLYNLILAIDREIA
jgi:hypothetical protein